MVQARVKLGEHEDRVLIIVKGKYGLKNKSQAINLVIDKFEKEFLEPELRPEYKTKLAKIVGGKHLSRQEFEKEGFNKRDSIIHLCANLRSFLFKPE